MTYNTLAYIAVLGLDKVPADDDWKGIKNPLTVYDRIEAIQKKYEYADLYDHFDNISMNGKRSLGAALFEWIINRVIFHYKEEMRSNYYDIAEAYWAGSINSRYGGCDVPDLEYELIINCSERDGSDANLVSSYWEAEGDIENILHTAIAFTANLEDVVDGPNEWLKRLYYLALYLMPEDSKSTFQKWFSIALERLENHTPNRILIGKYEDIFEERCLESRGLPVPPQLLDPTFTYQPEQNTELVNNFLQTLDLEHNRYLADPEELEESGFEGETFVFEGLINKERKSIDIKPFISSHEDLSSLKIIPSIIKAAGKEIDTTFEYSDIYTDDYDSYMSLNNPKLVRILEEIEGKAQVGLLLAVSEWVLYIVKDSPCTKKLQKLENLIEAMWAQMDQNYIKAERISPYLHEYEVCQDDDIAGYEEHEEIIDGLFEILAEAHNLYKIGILDFDGTLHAVLLARNIQKNKPFFDAWIHNVITRIIKDYPTSDKDKEYKDKISHTPSISRNYYFIPEIVYDELDEKEKLNTFIMQLDYQENTFLPSPEEMYLMSYIKGRELNEKPYLRDLQFNKEFTVQTISKLGLNLSRLGFDEWALASFDIAEQLDMNDWYSYRCRGHHYYNNKEYQSAIENYSKAITLSGVEPEVYYPLGASYYNLKEYEYSYENFMKAIERNKDFYKESKIKYLSDYFANEIKYLSDYFANKAYDAIENEQYDLVIELASKAIRLNPKNHVAYLNRSVGYTCKGDEEKNAMDIEMLKKLNPEGAARALINESVISNRKKNYKRAIEKATFALSLIDDNDKYKCDAYGQIGWAYGELKIFDEAFVNMSKAIEIDQSDVMMYANRGYYLRALGRLEEALEDYNIAVKLVSEAQIAFVYSNRGKAYTALGQYDKALADWQVVYEKTDDFEDLIYIIYAYACLGDIDKVKELLAKASKKKNDASDWDNQTYYFTQYAMQINMEAALSKCRELSETENPNKDYPYDQLVKVAMENGHPDKETLIELAKKINNTTELK